MLKGIWQKQFNEWLIYFGAIYSSLSDIHKTITIYILKDWTSYLQSAHLIASYL